MHKSRKMFLKSTVRCCIDRLLSEAEENYKSHPERAGRYLELVLKFIKRYKIRLPRKERLRFCKKCLSYWIKGDTLTVKSNKVFTEYICNNCNYKKRIPNRKE